MTWEDVNSNLAQRASSSLKSNLVELNKNIEVLILSSSNDIGVIRNGGRRGAAYGPKALSANLLKLAKRSYNSPIASVELCTPSQKICDFVSFQKEQSKKIQDALKNDPKISIHFGGGHDHAYPFVDAIIKEYGKVTVINLDAHLDTRNDGLKHSGTPFRQLKEEHGDNIQLIQVGIHDFANVCENYSELDMEIHTVEQIKKTTQDFAQSKKFIADIFKTIPDDQLIILSLDMDAIDGSEMPAVSAVNHDGLPMNFVREFYQQYKQRKQKSFLGIYEYNPLYDNLGCSSARAMASTLYQFII